MNMQYECSLGILFDDNGRNGALRDYAYYKGG